MADIAIFGDSFVDPYWMTRDGYSKPTTFTWLNELDKDHYVYNCGKAGTGPDYSITELIKWAKPMVEHKESKNYSVIFVCSDPCRLNLSCYKDPMEAVEIFDIAEGRRRHKSMLFAKQAIQWMMTDAWQFNQALLYYSLVNMYAPHFKRVLFWTVGNEYIYNNTPLTANDNMQHVSVGLNRLSIRDCGQSIYGQGVDERVNHFQESNHCVMYEQISNWINNGTDIDTSKFLFAGPLETK